jgi:hypothetical protein
MGVVAPMVMNPGMWISIVKVKPPQLADSEIESLKKFFLEYK